MPRHCSVSGCRSNYRTESEYTTTFAIPKQEPLRSQWLRNIPTDFSELKDPRVCIRHFKDSDVIFVDTLIVEGEIKKFPRKIPKYKENAVPVLFPNLPYLNSKCTAVRRLCGTRKFRKISPKSRIEVKECQERNKILNMDVQDTAVRRLCGTRKFRKSSQKSRIEVKECQERNRILNMDDIVAYFKENKKDSTWVVFKKPNKLVLCFMNIDTECPKLDGCIIVTESSKYTVFIDNIKIELDSKIFPEACLTSIPILEHIIKCVENKHLIL